MTYKIIVRPEAQREIQEAFDWYEERSEGLGAEFLRTADACLSGVQRNPDAYQKVHSEVHRALFRRFPMHSFISSLCTGQKLNNSSKCSLLN